MGRRKKVAACFPPNVDRGSAPAFRPEHDEILIKSLCVQFFSPPGGYLDITVNTECRKASLPHGDLPMLS
jgi:hypothetical protein